MNLFFQMATRSLVFFLIFSCQQAKILHHNNNLNVKTVLSGQVKVQTGNQMPMVNSLVKKGKPFPTTVYVFAPLNNTDLLGQEGQWCKAIQSTILDSIKTDSEGNYQIALVPGRYSILVGAYDGFFIPFFDQYNAPGSIHLKANQPLKLNILVNSKAIY